MIVWPCCTIPSLRLGQSIGNGRRGSPCSCTQQPPGHCRQSAEDRFYRAMERPTCRNRTDHLGCLSECKLSIRHSSYGIGIFINEIYMGLIRFRLNAAVSVGEIGDVLDGFRRSSDSMPMMDSITCFIVARFFSPPNAASFQQQLHIWIPNWIQRE